MVEVNLTADPVSSLPASAGSPGPIVTLVADAVTTLTATLGPATVLSGPVNFYGRPVIGLSELSKPTRFIPILTAEILSQVAGPTPVATDRPMRVRKLDADGDMCFGHGQKDFWRNVPEAPAQCAYTRLVFWKGEWFLDRADGTDWNNKVLGKHTETTRDPEIVFRVTLTKGINEVQNYSSYVNRQTREFGVNIVVDTIYGPAKIQGPI